MMSSVKIMARNLEQEYAADSQIKGNCVQKINDLLL